MLLRFSSGMMLTNHICSRKARRRVRLIPRCVAETFFCVPAVSVNSCAVAIDARKNKLKAMPIRDILRSFREGVRERVDRGLWLRIVFATMGGCQGIYGR